MVYAGFDQSIGRDCNGDGRITSDIDITGDGLVTLADREQGAFLAVNPWGRSWGDAAAEVSEPPLPAAAVAAGENGCSY